MDVSKTREISIHFILDFVLSRVKLRSVTLFSGKTAKFICGPPFFSRNTRFLSRKIWPSRLSLSAYLRFSRVIRLSLSGYPFFPREIWPSLSEYPCFPRVIWPRLSGYPCFPREIWPRLSEYPRFPRVIWPRLSGYPRFPREIWPSLSGYPRFPREIWSRLPGYPHFPREIWPSEGCPGSSPSPWEIQKVSPEFSFTNLDYNSYVKVVFLGNLRGGGPFRGATRGQTRAKRRFTTPNSSEKLIRDAKPERKVHSRRQTRTKSGFTTPNPSEKPIHDAKPER